MAQPASYLACLEPSKVIRQDYTFGGFLFLGRLKLNFVFQFSPCPKNLTSPLKQIKQFHTQKWTNVRNIFNLLG